jgi:hypothetical protein
MAINNGNGHRTGIVSKRTQTYNPKTEQFVKRDTTTGKFLSCKDTPFKNIRKEDVIKKKKETLEVNKKAKKEEKKKLTVGKK